jgi:hypothetical protein
MHVLDVEHRTEGFEEGSKVGQAAEFSFQDALYMLWSRAYSSTRRAAPAPVTVINWASACSSLQNPSRERAMSRSPRILALKKENAQG